MRMLILLPFAIILSNCALAQQNKKKMENPVILVIHGGAGTILKENMSPEKEKAYTDKLSEALREGYKVLQDSGTSLQAVQAAIMVMEDSPLFNAGKGSVFTNDEKIEMDAAIMNGENLKAGAVTGVRTVKNPIKAAYAVMTHSEHVMLVGEGADVFAGKNGCEIVDTSYFFDQNRFNQLQKVKEQEKAVLDHDGEHGMHVDSSAIEFNVDLNPDKKYGTVGAVALDVYGNLAAGTSTGGMTNKRYGRVGDAPIIGAGTYANNTTCAISCTGHGEFFIRNVVAYDVSALMEYKNYSLQKAAHYVVQEKLESQGGKGGLIGLDKHGNYVMEFNTPGMYRGVIRKDGTIEVGIYK
ncbi:MAG: isoaspartyl peptidase/L-asparaginase [Flavobacteriales bacterium]|nr:isoaspartyl peptidase/L-asparaginase [Flavobacteriales bacterium]